jgi:hypothetical protein
MSESKIMYRTSGGHLRRGGALADMVAGNM